MRNIVPLSRAESRALPPTTLRCQAESGLFSTPQLLCLRAVHAPLRVQQHRAVGEQRGLWPPAAVRTPGGMQRVSGGSESSRSQFRAPPSTTAGNSGEKSLKSKYLRRIPAVTQQDPSGKGRAFPQPLARGHSTSCGSPVRRGEVGQSWSLGCAVHCRAMPGQT